MTRTFVALTSAVVMVAAVVFVVVSDRGVVVGPVVGSGVLAPPGSAQAYHSVVLADDPVGYWRLGDRPGSTSIVDGSRQRRDATIHGRVTFGLPGAVAQDPSSSAVFQPMSFGDIAAVRSAPLRLTSAVSVELWLKTSTTAPTPGLMRFAADEAPYQGYVVGLNVVPGRPVGTIGFWDGVRWSGSQTPVNDGRWHDVVVTFNGGTVDFYVDGALDSVVTGRRSSLTVNPDDDSFGRIDGNLAELAVYPGALSAGRVAAHYEAGRSYYRSVVLDDGPVGYWRLDDQPGSETMSDSSGWGTGADVQGPVMFGTSEGAIQDPSSSAVFQPMSFGDIAAVRSAPLRLTSAVSVELWLKTSTTAPTPGLMRFAADEAPYQGYVVGLNVVPGRPVGTIGFWDGARWSGSQTPVNDGRWHDVVVTFNGGTVDFYVDGALDSVVTGRRSSLTVNPDDDSFGRIDGNLAELAVYPGALSAGRVVAHYEAGRSYYRSVVLDDGPVGYWRLDEAAGANAVHDSSTFDTPATVTPSVAFGQPGAIDQDPETAAAFTAHPAAVVDIASGYTGPLRLTTAVSLELWLKTATTAVVPDLMRFFNRDAMSQGYGLGLGTARGSPAGAIAFWDGTTWIGGVTAVNDGRWHHIVATFDHGTVNIYCDGVLDRTARGLVVALHVNRTGDSFGQIDGTLEGVAVYPGALSPAQVTRHFDAAGPGIVGRHGTALVLKDRPISFTGFNGPGVPTAAPDEGTFGCGTTFTDAFDQSFFAALPPDQLVRVWLFQAFAVMPIAPTGSTGLQILNWTGMDRLVGYAAQYHQHLDVVLSNQWTACDNGVGHYLAWYQGGYNQVDRGPYGGNIMSYSSWIRAVFTRYAGNPAIAMWEPVNEQRADASPTSCNEAAAAQALTAFNTWFVGVERSASPGRLTSSGQLGTGCGTYAPSDWAATQQPFDVWSIHYYDAASPNDAAAATLIATATKNLRPVIVGETGISIGVPSPASPLPSASCQATTAARRGTLFRAQQHAFFDAGVAAQLFWVLDVAPPSPGGCSDSITTGDPSFALLRPG